MEIGSKRVVSFPCMMNSWGVQSLRISHFGLAENSFSHLGSDLDLKDTVWLQYMISLKDSSH